MTVRPIDMQTLIPRSSEVSKVQYARESQPTAEQQQAQMKIRHQADQGQRQVNQAEMTPPESRIHPDGESGKERRQHQRGRSKKDQPDELAEPGKGSRLDLKL